MTIDEYSQGLTNYMGSDDFLRLGDAEKQDALKGIRQRFLDENPDADVDLTDSITESYNKSFLRGTGRGRVIPDIDPKLLGLEGIDKLSKDERTKRIEEFELRIPELVDANPTQREDTKFFLDQTARELKRRNNGEGRNWFTDKGVRIAEGFFAGLLNYVGANELAEDTKDFFFENPDYDENFTSKLAQGLGDLGASMTVFIGASLATSGLGGSAAAATSVATGASFLSNSVMRYNEAYKQAIDLGLDEASASDAGLSAMPAAAIDVLGDKIIASKLLPNNINKVFQTGTHEAKKRMLNELMLDASGKSKLLEIGQTALSEGVTEVVGDLAAGYGPYLVTGKDDFVPSSSELIDSFLVGAVLGGGITTAANTRQFLGNKTGASTTDSEGNIIPGSNYSTVNEMHLGETDKNLDKIDPSLTQPVYDMLANGQYGKAMQLSSEILEAQAQAAQQQSGPNLDPTTKLNIEESEEVDLPANQANILPLATPLNQRVYQDLSDVVNSSGQAFNQSEISEEQAQINLASNERLNTAAPSRAVLHESIDSLSGNTQLQPVQLQTVKTVFDTLAARWLSVNPDQNINEFYQKLNIKSDADLNQIADLSASFLKEPRRIQTPAGGRAIRDVTTGDVSTEAAPIQGEVETNRRSSTLSLSSKANIDTVLGGMMHMLRSSGAMQEILTPSEMDQVRQSLGVEQDFTNENDTELANRFKGWLQNGESDISPVFSKLKQWISDLYKGLRRLVSPENRNTDLDSVFESLFQMTLSPQEFSATQGQKAQADKTNNVEGPSVTNQESTNKFEEAKNEVRKVFGPRHTYQAPVETSQEDSAPAKATEVLLSMAESNEENSPVFNRMIEDIRIKNPDVSMVIDPSLRAEGSYNPNTNTITIGKPSLRVIAHEVTHALSYSDLKSTIDSRKEATYSERLDGAMQDENTPEYIKNLIQVYRHSAKMMDQLKAIGSEIDSGTIPTTDRKVRRFVSLHEFISEAMSSQEFQEDLSLIPYQGQNVWSRIANVIADALTWIRSIANPEIILRSDGENALTATLASVNQIVNSGELNIKDGENQYSISEGRDAFTKEALLEGRGGYKSRTILVEIPIDDFLNLAEPLNQESRSEARQLFDQGIQFNEPIQLWINDSNVSDSRVIGHEGRHRATVLKEAGISTIPVSITTTNTRWSEQDNPNKFDYRQIPTKVKSENGKLELDFPINRESYLKQDQIILKAGTPVSNQENQYSLSQQRNQILKDKLARFKALTRQKINDKFDSKTQYILGLMQTIKASDIHKLGELDPEMQDYFFRLVDNVYESRKNAVSDPQNRINSEQVFQQVSAIKKMVDQMWISDAIDNYDGLINWGDIDMNDRTAVAQAINTYLNSDENLDAAKRLETSEKRKATLARKDEKRRVLYKKLREVSQERFVTPDNYVDELESIWGGSLAENPVLREFMKLHYQNLHEVDIDNLSGPKLAKYFYALNNLYDGNGGYFKLTIEVLANQRNEASEISTLQGTFRDPVLDSSKILNALDDANRKAELISVQADRFSSYEKTRDFIQNDLLGELFDGIMRVSKNREAVLKQEMVEAIEAFESEVGRNRTPEDRAIEAIASRLMQYESGKNPDKELKKNIRKERQSIENIMRIGDASDRRLYRTLVDPIFKQMTDGLEDMETGSMQLFLDTLDGRMRGSGSVTESKARQNLLQVYQNIFSGFDLESRLISEGFHETPFNPQVFYVPNNVISKVSTPSGQDAKLTDPAHTFEQEAFQSGIKSKDSHYHSRQEKLRDDQYYSYNIESMADRNITRMSVDNSTIVERFVISERLNKKSELNAIISDGPIQNSGRINGLTELAKSVVSNAISRGEPANLAVSAFRKAVNTYARFALSGLHHIITQPLTAFSDYAVRTGNIKGWFDSLSYYTMNTKKVDDWFTDNLRWVADRGILNVMSLDTRSLREEGDWENQPAIDWLNKFYDGASKVITYSIHTGDRYSAKVTILAEYARLLKQKGYRFERLEDMDLSQVEGRILSQAVRNVERNINTSQKAMRGELFSDRRMTMTVIRNMLFAFSSHTANLATQGNMAIRDIIELRSMGATREEILPKIQTLAAIFTQNFTFTTARFAFSALMASAMVGVIRDLFDDEDGKIAELQEKVLIAREKGDPVKIAEAEQEVAMAKSVREVVEKIKQQSMTGGSLFKSILRDQAGSVNFLLTQGDVNRLLFWVPDQWSEHIHKEASKEIEADYLNRIRQAKKDEDIKLAARLEEDLTVFKAQQYIPMAYKDYSSFQLGGVYGAAVGFTERGMGNIFKGAIGAKEFSFNDLAMSLSMIGIGQADAQKLMNNIDKIENEQWELINRYNESTLPRAQKSKKDKEDRETEQLMRSLLR